MLSRSRPRLLHSIRALSNWSSCGRYITSWRATLEAEDLGVWDRRSCIWDHINISIWTGLFTSFACVRELGTRRCYCSRHPDFQIICVQVYSCARRSTLCWSTRSSTIAISALLLHKLEFLSIDYLIKSFLVDSRFDWRRYLLAALVQVRQRLGLLL